MRIRTLVHYCGQAGPTYRRAVLGGQVVADDAQVRKAVCWPCADVEAPIFPGMKLSARPPLGIVSVEDQLILRKILLISNGYTQKQTVPCLPTGLFHGSDCPFWML